MDKNILIIGSGQGGVRIASLMHKKYDYPKDSLVLFNTNVDDKFDRLHILKDANGTGDGSGRNPIVTLNTIIPENERYIIRIITTSLKKVNARTVILFNSLGGGTGSMLNHWIAENILIPMRNENNLRIFMVPVFGFKHEGNPILSNSIAMLGMYYNLTSDVAVFPVQNDVVYEKGVDNTYDVTNEKIVDHVFSILDYEYFLGEHKEGGIGTLDKNEHRRITGPCSGFMSFIETPLNKFKSDKNPLNDFKVNTASAMIVMFRTKDGESVDIKYLKTLKSKFPNALKIFAESRVEDDSIVEIILNGIELPDKFVKQSENIIKSSQDLKQQRKDTKKNNRTKMKLGKKSLFSI